MEFVGIKHNIIKLCDSYEVDLTIVNIKHNNTSSGKNNMKLKFADITQP